MSELSDFLALRQGVWRLGFSPQVGREGGRECSTTTITTTTTTLAKVGVSSSVVYVRAPGTGMAGVGGADGEGRAVERNAKQ